MNAAPIINLRTRILVATVCLYCGVTHADPAERTEEADGHRHLHNVALALHGYHDIFGHFPPAILTGPDGETAYSWRVEILPVLKYYVEEPNGSRLVDIGKDDRVAWWNVIRELGYTPDETWDSPTNSGMFKQISDSFRRPGDTESHYTAVFMVTGPAAASSDHETISLSQMREPGRTLMLVQAIRNVPWTEPADIEYSTFAPVPEFGGFLDGAFLVSTFDGAVHRVAETVPERDLRALITLDATDTFTIPGIPWTPTTD